MDEQIKEIIGQINGVKSILWELENSQNEIDNDALGILVMVLGGVIESLNHISR